VGAHLGGRRVAVQQLHGCVAQRHLIVGELEVHRPER
jgi:hypothetical protein